MLVCMAEKGLVIEPTHQKCFEPKKSGHSAVLTNRVLFISAATESGNILGYSVVINATSLIDAGNEGKDVATDLRVHHVYDASNVATLSTLR